MRVRFHPVYDNPLRVGYVPGWKTIEELVERVGDLEHVVGEGRIVPAPWEPFYKECPGCRHAGTYRWAQAQLQSPAYFAQALALFPGDAEHPATRIGHANLLILSTRTETSRVTKKLMLIEALELWEYHAADWLNSIVQACAELGVETSAPLLHQQVMQILQPLAEDPAPEEEAVRPDLPAGSDRNRGFEKEIMQLDNWTPDPGVVILPVDTKTHALKRQILRLDHAKAVLLKARKSARSVAWEKVTLVHLFEGAIIFEIFDEPPMAIHGYENPEHVLTIIQNCYKAATERLLQALAAKVTRPTP